ncbi:DMT family transporter [Roseovarius aestuariivivens]|uniref:DMT family transporter n=1 Tax=Roseovarius aestuariivivens TaxID=1888910 RepID=UPI001FD8922B|nr:DMT family transporter [Roseovarius aestuariivivens]
MAGDCQRLGPPLGDRLFLSVVLIAMGAGWGLCIPLAKVAVSTGYGPLGLIFWQVAIVAGLMLGFNALRGRRFPSLRRAWGLLIAVAMLGAVLPDVAYYTAAQHLPGGVLSIVISSVPIFAFPLALLLGNDRFRAIRLLGLLFGFGGILLLLGPQAGLPQGVALLFVPVALIAPFCYASEVNVVARFGTYGLDPIQVLAAASVLAMAVTLPLALVSGQWINPLPPYGIADLALVANSTVHAAVYATYVWLTGRAGSVFTAQVSYLVTGFGVLWSMALLQESYSSTLWASLALMVAGIFLVQPKPAIPLAPTTAMKDDASDGTGHRQS